LVGRAACLAGALALAAPAGADECRLALALAMDVSSSVDADEDRLQRAGLAAALLAPEVQAAMFGADLPVAIAVFEWSGRYNQKLLVDWTLVGDRAVLVDIAATLARSTRSHDDFPTAMGYALGYGAGLLERAPPCLFRTLDMAGDGINNEGFPPDAAYKEFPFAGVTVNGLVVDGGPTDGEVDPVEYYRREVVRGPGAFLQVAAGFEDYERAMRRKLEREVASQVMGDAPRQPAALPGETPG